MTYKCPKCEGHGKINAFGHVQAGVCFKCGGSGSVANKPIAPSVKWVCVYAGADVFTIKAKSESQALKVAITHWKSNSDKPAFASVASESDVSVRQL
jgi:RecJ-like exonuclease